MHDDTATITHNTALERQAMREEAIDPTAICITVGADGRAHYGRNQAAADLRARKRTFLGRTMRAFGGWRADHTTTT